MVKGKGRLIIALIIAFVLILSVLWFVLWILPEAPFIAKEVTEQGKWIVGVEADKARYIPGEEVIIKVKVQNPSDQEFKGKVTYMVKHLERKIESEEQGLVIKENGSKDLQFKWKSSKEDYKGYSVEVWLSKGQKLIDVRTTAIDISSDWSRFPRYGYITNFDKMDPKEISNKIALLNRFHINGLQFYDWQNTHHKPLAGTVEKPNEKWKDIANRDVYFETVKSYIDEAHRRNMVAMNYNLMYGAYRLSEKDGVKKEWGLFKDPDGKIQDGHPLPQTWATSKLIFLNPANKEWQNYLFREEKKVFEVLSFDGWHVDQLGDRGLLYDYDGKIVQLEQTFSPFLINAKRALGARLVFNAVNQYGQIDVAKNAPVDFLYAELWPPSFSNYDQLKQVIDMNRNLVNGEKNTVLAAYMNYGMADRKGEFNEPGVLLTDSVIFASGGAHIELGDTGMLSKEYFPSNNLSMSESLVEKMEDYYNFLVAYQNLLRDGVTERDTIVTSDQVPLSNYAKSGSIWYFAKEKAGYEILHLINFSNQSSLAWRDDQGTHSEPETINDFTIKYYTEADITGVYLASPNFDEGIATSLSFSKGQDDQGKYLKLTIPALQYWDMIYFTKK